MRRPGTSGASRCLRQRTHAACRHAIYRDLVPLRHVQPEVRMPTRTAPPMLTGSLPAARALLLGLALQAALLRPRVLRHGRRHGRLDLGQQVSEPRHRRTTSRRPARVARSSTRWPAAMQSATHARTASVAGRSPHTGSVLPRHEKRNECGHMLCSRRQSRHRDSTTGLTGAPAASEPRRWARRPGSRHRRGVRGAWTA